MDDLAEYLFEHRARGVKPAWIADILERLMWLLDDNGAAIDETLRRWIDSGDIERARVALSLEESFLYNTRSEMASAFDQLCARFPELRNRCVEILAQWDQQHPNDEKNA